MGAGEYYPLGATNDNWTYWGNVVSSGANDFTLDVSGDIQLNGTSMVELQNRVRELEEKLKGGEKMFGRILCWLGFHKGAYGNKDAIIPWYVCRRPNCRKWISQWWRCK